MKRRYKPPHNILAIIKPDELKHITEAVSAVFLFTGN
jgi:uncharacterized protein YlxW (UPF0749 family)